MRPESDRVLRTLFKRLDSHEERERWVNVMVGYLVTDEGLVFAAQLAHAALNEIARFNRTRSAKERAKAVAESEREVRKKAGVRNPAGRQRDSKVGKTAADKKANLNLWKLAMAGILPKSPPQPAQRGKRK